MRIADQWQDFEILDTSSGEKLERWGEIPSSSGRTRRSFEAGKGPEWQKADARYNRSSAGGGSWRSIAATPVLDHRLPGSEIQDQPNRL